MEVWEKLNETLPEKGIHSKMEWGSVTFVVNFL